MHEIITAYNAWLQKSKLPKLLLYATPGGLINARTLAWCTAQIPNLKTVDIGKGIHYIQEDNPHLIGKELAAWYKGL